MIEVSHNGETKQFFWEVFYDSNKNEGYWRGISW